MATGKPPFTGKSTGAIFHQIVNNAPTAPVRLNPELPDELEQILNKALEKDRGLRYQSANDLLVDLRRLKRATTTGVSVMLAWPMASIINARPGPEVAVIAFTPPKEAPIVIVMARVMFSIKCGSMLMGGSAQAESPECTPASSICSIIPPIMVVCPSQMASTSNSKASSTNLSIKTG